MPVNMSNLISHDQLLACIHYDASTGVFTRKSRDGSWSPTGNVSGGGYVTIYVGGRSYAAGRLAWFWMTGIWPEAEVDHRDLNRQNNAWANLREALPVENTANKGVYQNNTSGFKGVNRLVVRGRFIGWRARIGAGRQRRSLGVFQTPEEAHAAYVEAARRLHGEFARTE
jgi:hypothetical protein